MSYKISAKNRKFKSSVLKVASFIKFDSLNLTTQYKIILFGTIIGIISLFLEWIVSVDNTVTGNSFSSVLGITGILLLITHIKTLFIIFSKKIKDLIKNTFKINIKDTTLLLFLITFNFSITINSLFIINNLVVFKDGIFLGNGIIWALVGVILNLVGIILLILTKTKTGVYVDNPEISIEEYLNQPPRDVENENNMKFPF